jgi:hypothetical protein
MYNRQANAEKIKEGKPAEMAGCDAHKSSLQLT